MLQSQLSGVLCLQESQTIRLQRLIQQRKRMEHMSVLLQQQNDTIAILKRQNQSINKQFYEAKVQNELINDKLIVSCNHAEDLTELIVKQSSLIETLKQALFGNFHIDQYQKVLLLQEIQQSLSVYQTIKSGAFSAQNKHFKDEIQRLNEQNQQWQQKYQDLCQNYLQVTKHCKLLEFQSMKHNNHGKKQNSKEKNIQKSEKSQQCSSCKLISQNSNSQIDKLKKLIEQKKVQISLKDKLIEQHRKNEKQQKKLLKFLKEKFNQEGRQLSQIAKSTQNIDISPLSKQQVMTYEVIKNGDKVSQSYFIPHHTLQEKTLNVNPTFGNITASKAVNKMGKSKVKIVEVNSVSKHDVTSSKNKVSSSTVKDDRSSLLLNGLSPDSGFKKTVSKCLIQP